MTASASAQASDSTLEFALTGASAHAVEAVNAAVMPLRYSSDTAAMIAFLRTLGLQAVITAGDDAFGQLRAAGGGHVMVHRSSASHPDAPSGVTDLCLLVEDVDSSAEALRAHGLTVRAWDEALASMPR